MQLVIEISDGLYNNLDTIKNGSIASKIILDCVRKGQVLPNVLPKVKDKVRELPTIIEADKGDGGNDG